MSAGPGPPASAAGDAVTADVRHDAFLSYSHQDREFAAALRDALSARGKDVWLDEAGIRPAERWELALRRAIEASDTFVFAISPDSARSQECRKELEHALALNKRVVPVVARPVDPRQLPAELGARQFVPPRGTFEGDFDYSLQLLLDAIETDLEWVRDHTEWGLKALEWEQHGRDESFLLSDSELDAAEQWLARQAGKRPAPTALHNQFVLYSRRRAVRRLRRSRGLTGVALAIVSALAVIAFVLRNQAVSEGQLANSRRLAADSLLELSSDPQLSLLLGVRSAQVRHTSEALDALRRALPANHLLQTFPSGSPITAGALSPDGTMVAAGDQSGTVRVWELGGGLTRLLRGHAAPVQGVVFSADSRRVLSWAQDGTARLWNVAQPASAIVFRAPDYRVTHAALSPDGRLVAVATFLHSAPLVFDSASGKRLFALGSATTPVPDIEFSPNGHELAIGGVDGSVRLWSAANGAPAGNLPAGQTDVDRVRFSPDGRYLLASTSDANGASPRSRLWDLATRRPLSPPLRGGDGEWNPDGRLVSTTGPDSNARIWTAPDGRLLQTLHGPDPIAGPAYLSRSTAGGSAVYAITGSQSGTADIWSAADGTIVAPLVGTQGAVSALGFTPDGGHAVTSGTDGSARVWSTGLVTPQPAPSGAELAGTVRGLGGAGNLVPRSSISGPDPLSPLAAFYGPASGQATVVDARTGGHLSTVRFPSGGSVGPAGSNGYVSFDASGRVMLVLGNGPAEIHSARRGGLLHTLRGPGSLATAGAVSPDGRLVAGADSQDRVGVWEVSSGRQLVRFGGHRPLPGVAASMGLKFSPDGTLLLSADQSGITIVLDARTGRIRSDIRGLAPPARMYNAAVGGAISPDDRFVVSTSGWDNDAHVFQVGQPGQLIELRGHSDGIDDAAFSLDGSLIATTAGHSRCTGAFVGPTCDNSTRVWDLQQSSPLLTLRDDGGLRVVFSPDGTGLIVSPPFPYASLACMVCGGFSRIVPLAEAAEVRHLTAEERMRYQLR